MADSFAAAIEAWAQKVEGAAEAIFHTAAQSLVEEMQTAGPSKATAAKAIAGAEGLSGKGRKANRMGPIPNPGGSGRLPVDTGFLRASLTASTTSMPVLRDDARPEDGKRYEYDAGAISLIIQGADLGQTLYVGYVAAYARRVHFEHYQWVTLAAQRWQQHVDAATAEVKAELGL